MLRIFVVCYLLDKAPIVYLSKCLYELFTSVHDDRNIPCNRFILCISIKINNQLFRLYSISGTIKSRLTLT